ncbi:MAG: nicotinamide mononucleotide transporter [Deltaproteobacteria bacterium]|nr:nicotinamide mononucleotide transporter [Deltaproteobacteria bacterium]
MIEAVMWCVTVAAIVGTIANAKQKIWCFPIWITTNLAFTGYSVYKVAYPQAALFLVYAGLAIYGWVTWSRKAKERT